MKLAGTNTVMGKTRCMESGTSLPTDLKERNGVRQTLQRLYHGKVAIFTAACIAGKVLRPHEKCVKRN